MTTAEQKQIRKINRTVAAYNMVPNLFWSALFLVPITVFCYNFVNLTTTYILLGVCMVPAFFPNVFYDKIQLSNKAAFYKKIGVKHINTLAQNGTLLNRFLKKKYPQFKVVSTNRTSIVKQYYQTYFFEKFHFCLFLFFMCITVFAFVETHICWALILLVSNILYNVYPNLLQQYVRVKLRSAIKGAKFQS